MIGNQASGKIDNRLPARVLPEQIRRRFALDGVASRLRLSASRHAWVPTQMSTEVKSNLQLTIGHALFIDVVGYSKRLIDDQRELQQKLNEIVRGTEQFHTAEAAGKLVRLPTGDGMALVFFTSPEAPVQCALEISQALPSYPHLKLRMGIHSGPVIGTADVNDRSNVAGAGINIAQRVMACGDAGHILLSKRAADDLAQYRHWQSHLHDVGEGEVKEGGKISVG